MYPNVYCPDSKTNVDLLAPTPESIHLVDIARGLSGNGRYSNQLRLRRVYSVAQHSLLVASRVPRQLRLAAALHDAAEAYIGDVAAPLKQLLHAYEPIETNLMRAVHKAFGIKLTQDEAECIRWHDLAIRQDELYWLCKDHPRRDGAHEPDPKYLPITPWPRELARLTFKAFVSNEMRRAGRDCP